MSQTKDFNAKVKFMWLHWCVYICEWCLYVITRDGADDSATWLDKRIKGDTFKNCAPFIESKREINNIQVDNAKDLDVVMTKCNLIKYSNNHWKASGSLWLYYQMNKMLFW